MMKNNILTIGIPVGFSALALLYYYFCHDDKKDREKRNKKVHQKKLDGTTSKNSNTAANSNLKHDIGNGSNDLAKEERVVAECKTDSPSVRNNDREESLTKELPSVIVPNQLETDIQSEVEVNSVKQDKAENNLFDDDIKVVDGESTISEYQKNEENIEEKNNFEVSEEMNHQTELSCSKVEEEASEVVQENIIEGSTVTELETDDIVEKMTNLNLNSSMKTEEGTAIMDMQNSSPEKSDCSVQSEQHNKSLSSVSPDTTSGVNSDSPPVSDSGISVVDISENIDIENVVAKLLKDSISEDSVISPVTKSTNHTPNGNAMIGDDSNANKTIDLSESIIDVSNGNEEVKQQALSISRNDPFSDFWGEGRFYSNHLLVSGFTFNDDGTPYDSQFVWGQPNDGKVFVKGSAGQPLVPNYLRNESYLVDRPVPIHHPEEYAFIAKNMKPPSFPASQWVRVISISDSLEIRVRHDQRDMLLDQLEQDGIVEENAPPISASALIVGCLVATKLNIPLRGNIWCRVIIKNIVLEQDGGGRRANRRHNRPREPLFLVESIDYFPIKSEKPIPVSQLRPLTQDALSAPFFDEIVYLTNCMPKNGSYYEKTARDALEKLVRESCNFLYIKDSVSTFINGYVHCISPLYARVIKNGSKLEVSVHRHLMNLHCVVPIYEGLVSDKVVYCLCMFKDNDAFWMNDNRHYDQLSPVWPKADYIYVTGAHSVDPKDLRGYQGFRIPYRNAFSGFTNNDFNLTSQQFMQLKQLDPSNQSSSAQQFLRQSLLRKEVPLDCNFSPQVLCSLFHCTSLKNTPQDQELSPNVYAVKEINGFFYCKNPSMLDMMTS